MKLGSFLASEAASDEDLIRRATAANAWFTEDNIQYAFKNWSSALSESQLEKWLANYQLTPNSDTTVAVIMAGNIPLVGFHDFLSVLIAGKKVVVKLSSNDTILLPYVAQKLISIDPEFTDRIQFTDEKLSDFDAVIATGSNNTARYFDYYFGTYPNIIRKNRNSVAVLNGNETEEQLEQLANDVFRYFGLGCRNVSKIFVPKGYDFQPLFQAMFSWKDVIMNHKYMNNYDYNKAVYLMSNMQLLDNEFMLLKEDEGYASPISVLYYEYFSDTAALKSKLKTNQDAIQVVIGAIGLPNEVGFGQAQQPKLWDYADGIDTMDFLLKLS